LDDTALLHTPSYLRRSSLTAASQSLLKSLALLLVHLLWAWWVMRLTPAAGSGSGALVHHGGLLWAPAGLALAALLCWGTRQLPVLWLGNLMLALLLDTPPLLALALACSQVFGPWVAAHWLKSVGFQTPLQRGRDMVQLIVLGGLCGSGLSALGACLALQAAGLMPGHTALAHLLLSWTGQALGALGLTALLMRLARFKLAGLAAVPSSWPAILLSASLAVACLAATALLLQEPQLGVASLSWLLLTLGLFSVLALRGQGSLAVGTLPLILGGLSLATAQAQGPLATLSSIEQSTALALYGFTLSLLPGLLFAQRAEMHEERRHWQGLLAATGIGLAEWRLGHGQRGLRKVQLSSQACPTWVRYIGAQPERDAWPSDWLAVAHPLDRERCRQAIESLLPPGGPDEVLEPLRLNTAAGQWHWYELKGSVQQRDAQGHSLRLLTLLSDVNWQHQAEERQRMSVALFQHLHEGLAVTDTDYRVLDANPSFCRMLGLQRDDLVGQPAPPLTLPVLRTSGLNPEHLQQQLLSEGFWQARVQAARADGSACQLQLTVSSIPEPNGPLRYRVITMSDLTLALQQQELLDRQARFDPLTGLPNQDEFMRLLRQGLESSQREGFRLSICRLDLDQFKHINAELGPERGDSLLLQVAQRLQSALRSSPQWSDVVARLGGDEFGLLLRTHGPEEAQQALERLLAVVAQPYQLETCTPQSLLEPTPVISELSASIGATLFPQDDSDAETLMRHAGHALYRVKHGGRKGFQLFDTAKRLRNEASLIALARVQQALDAGELQLHFQPKIDMQTGQVLGMEALLRWQHPERGLLGPAHFLPLIESTGLGVQVGDWVMEQALKHSEQWLAQGLRLNISVNVTARQLQMPDFAQRLLELIQRHSEPVARHLCLEVLESAALADITATQALIKRCRGYGVSFALDDFGTGYSTLTYLQRLPVDALKIDRSFVQNMLINSQDSALVEGVIGLARNFGCTVVAEGVETAAHARALLRLGCIHGQGNGIAEAMPAGEVEAWVRQFPQSGWMQALRAREAGGGGSL